MSQAAAFEVLDLFSAAAGGWSLGMHRAGFKTKAACEWIEWRRALYAENNPGVLIYDDVRTVTADRLRADLGTLPRIIVGSPPCQDISSANTKGKGVEGERSGLFFEAVRIIGEVRPRWFALENSANLRTRGADAVLGALEALDYACWTFVVGGDDIGANHERKRSWIIGCDLAQLDAHPYHQGQFRSAIHAEVEELRALADHHGADDVADSDGVGRDEGRSGRWGGFDLSVPQDPRDTSEDGRGSGLPRGCSGATDEPEQPTCGHAVDAAGVGHEGGRSRRHGADGDGSSPASEGDAGHSHQGPGSAGLDPPKAGRLTQHIGGHEGPDADAAGDDRLQRQHADFGQVGLCEADRSAAFQHRADWSLDDLAAGLLLDDGLPAWVAGARVAVGGPRGTSAASLIVEAFGDSVLPQIPEAIGRAILRVESAYAALHAESLAA